MLWNTGEVSVDKISSIIVLRDFLIKIEGDFDFFGASFIDFKGISLIKYQFLRRQASQI